MSKVELRSLEPGDLALVSNKPLPYRLRGVTMVVDDVVAGVGGMVFRTDGSVWLGAFLTPPARRHALTLHRAALRVIQDARRLGVPQLFAIADLTQARSQAWLERLGFRPTEHFEQGSRVWLWTADQGGRSA